MREERWKMEKEKTKWAQILKTSGMWRAVSKRIILTHTHTHKYVVLQHATASLECKLQNISVTEVCWRKEKQ